MPMVVRMGGSRSYGMGLAAASLASGIGAVALDASALGLVAGLAGAGAAAVLASAMHGCEQAAVAGRARTEELAAAVAAAVARADDAEGILAAMDRNTGPDLSAEEAEALVDPVTGLYGERYFAVTLASRVAAARRHLRPVAVVLVEVASGVKEGVMTGADPNLVSAHVTATLREADTACHLDRDRFGLVLEDTPENGAVWTVERVRRALSVERKDLTLWAGVACYPAHAFDADDLLARASAALEAAKEWRQDRIEVATTSDV
jgi:two-component system cell cycle response regulator